MADPKDSGVPNTEIAPTQAEPVESKAVTMVDVEAYIQKALNPFRAALRVSEKGKTVATEPAAEPVGKSTPDAVIEARLKTLEEGTRALREEKIDLAIERDALDEGLDPKHLKQFKKLFKAEYKDNLSSTDAGVVFKEFEQDTPKPLRSLISDYFRGEGEIFKAAVQTPGTRGVRSSGSAVRSLGSEKSVLDMSMDERLKLVTFTNGQMNTAQLSNKLRAQ